MCWFEHEGKELKLLPLQPKARKFDQKPTAPKKTKGVNLISVKDFHQELKNGAPFMILAAREVVEKNDSTIPPEVTPVIKKFSDVLPEDILNKLLQCMTSNTLSI